MPLFLAFLMIPIIEIALFITVGGAIGVFPTLLIVVATAVIGTILMRQQGSAILGDLQKSFSQMDDPTTPLAHGAMVLFAGALLLTPGFFTDAFGFALLIPATREGMFKFVKSRMTIVTADSRASAARNQPQDGADVIDGEYFVPNETNEPPNKTSKWSKD